MNKKALLHLAKDPVLKKLIKNHKLVINQHSDLFEDLISSIISQQLSVKAAQTIQNRFEALYKNKFPTPKQILKTSDEKIRGCGMSYSKIKYIKGIAQAVLDGSLDLPNLPYLPDHKAVEELTKLKGVGTWTAEMFLMFSLGRQDIFSMGDLGLRSAMAKLYGVDRDDIKAIEAITIKWSPYRTIACRYLWASLDNTPKK
ncbi:MAG: DNA-3-methyladenine glycosylase II [Candidatus Woesebacteria bacterium GW2011_GWB1_38_5b]|uniref:DNA-3-methyladenine glycosylase II n=1 Tax=Candidatus Woesebacteria bacterium GW2011_GWB1_38_5b TaxID=1618569 RepID=A0A0G0NDJ9_9BACT|nr:MAG: DNA-3-methyladenine glycosylase II [Candidatus Woesebacteria bacterium GW2011_GWB1_38_5b]KKQ76866.1 MAG: DNA-3-methyladenine glycosylase II [Parcubacteria group bacterium GW2011_GWA1_38_7]